MADKESLSLSRLLPRLQAIVKSTFSHAHAALSHLNTTFISHSPLRKHAVFLFIFLQRRHVAVPLAVTSFLLFLFLLSGALLAGRSDGPSKSQKMWGPGCKNGGNIVTAIWCRRWLPKRPQAVGPQFIFVYDLPRHFNRDLVRETARERLPPEVELEQLLYSFLERSAAYRTTDPDTASLFFIPVLPASWAFFKNRPVEGGFTEFHLFMEQYKRRAGGKGGGAHGAVTGEEGADSYDSAQQFLAAAMNRIQESSPYWHRSRGADHFLLSTHHWGRCGISIVNPRSNGRLFSVLVSPLAQLSALGRPISTYPSPLIKQSVCYIESTDVVIPPYINEETLSPEKVRHTSLLILLLVSSKEDEEEELAVKRGMEESGLLSQGRSKSKLFSSKNFFRKNITAELQGSEESQGAARVSESQQIDNWLTDHGMAGDWDVWRGGRSEKKDASFWEGEEGMGRAKVCLCVPGRRAGREVECLARAILKGCVPFGVSEEARAWANQLAVSNAVSFVTLFDVQSAFASLDLARWPPGQLATLQRNVATEQPRFSYDHTRYRNNAIHYVVEKRLREIGGQLGKKKRV